MEDTDQHQFKDRYMLRFPDGMRDRIKRAAEANGRSMNAEIIATLEMAYPATNYRTAIQNIRVLMEDTVRLGYPGGAEPLRRVAFEMADEAKAAGVDVSDLLEGL